MINRIRFTWQLLILSSVMLILGLILLSQVRTGLGFNAFVITLAVVTGINLITYYVISLGSEKNSGDQMMYLMLGIGLKFLLYLLYILGYWLVTKNLTIPFFITFFVLYLAFTFFLAGHMFKLLRNK
jgi:hypothetical protein